MLLYVIPVIAVIIVICFFNTISSHYEKSKKGVLEEENQFDRLPISLLCLIFEKVGDADSLSRCITVSKLFASVVPTIHSISLAVVVCRGNLPRQLGSFQVQKPAPVPPVVPVRKYLIRRILANSPLFLLNLLRVRPIEEQKAAGNECKFQYYSVKEVLKGFTEIETLKLEIHNNGAGRRGTDNKLKWIAEFGTELESCFILGRKSFIKREEEIRVPEDSEELSEKETTLRVVWTMSCLTAASVRYKLVKQVISDQRSLRRVEVIDTIGKGRLIMRNKQIEKMRIKSMENSDDHAALKLSMKIWYVPKIEVSSLMVIRPAIDDKQVEERDEDLLERIWGDRKEERESVEVMKKMMKMKMEKVCTLKIDMKS